MATSEIDSVFRDLIARFGTSELKRRLELVIEHAEQPSSSSHRKNEQRKQAKSRERDALSHVDSMEMPSRRKEKLRILAIRFTEKSFLPRISDVRNFFYMHGVDTSAVKSRQATVNRLFFFLSTLSEDRLDAIIHDSSFSGPARLEPIASAIKEKRRVHEEPVEPDGGENNNEASSSE